jgi:hypothetical protein
MVIMTLQTSSAHKWLKLARLLNIAILSVFSIWEEGNKEYCRGTSCYDFFLDLSLRVWFAETETTKFHFYTFPSKTIDNKVYAPQYKMNHGLKSNLLFS